MDEEAAVHDLRRARRGVRHTGERVRIALPYIVLSRFRKTGDQPLMDRAYRTIPRGRGTAPAQLGNDVDECGEAILIPTIACGLHQPEKSCPPKRVHGLPGYPPLRLCGLRQFPELGYEIVCRGHQGGECGRGRHRRMTAGGS